MKKKNFKNFKLNKQKISVLDNKKTNNIVGAATTGTCTITVTILSDAICPDRPLSENNGCADSKEDNSCQCTIA